MERDEEGDDEEVEGAGEAVAGFGGLGVVAGLSSLVIRLECSSLPASLCRTLSVALNAGN